MAGVRRTLGMVRFKAAVLISLLLLSLVVPLFHMAAVHAAPDPGINLQISPLPIDLVAEPGKTITTDLRIRNGGTQTEKIKVTLRKFSAQGEEGKVVLEDREPADNYFDWVKFSKNVFDAPPGEWQTIKMTISVPATAAFGYYYAVQFARAEPAKPEPGKSAIEGAVAIFVLLEASNPGAVRKAEVVEFSAARQVYEFLPTTFNVKVKNTGNVHVKPEGNIFISQGNSEIGMPIEINSGAGNILPGSIRNFSTKWTNGFPLYVDEMKDGLPVLNKNGQPTQTLKWDFNNSLAKVRFGQYTAKLLLVYDDGRRDIPIEANVNFWVIPWRLVGVGVVLLALLAFFIYKYRRMRRQLKKLKGKNNQ